MLADQILLTVKHDGKNQQCRTEQHSAGHHWTVPVLMVSTARLCFLISLALQLWKMGREQVALTWPNAVIGIHNYDSQQYQQKAPPEDFPENLPLGTSPPQHGAQWQRYRRAHNEHKPREESRWEMKQGNTSHVQQQTLTLSNGVAHVGPTDICVPWVKLDKSISSDCEEFLDNRACTKGPFHLLHCPAGTKKVQESNGLSAAM